MDEDEFAARLEREIAIWQKEGLVSEEQVATLTDRYRGAAHRRGRAALALAFLGATLVGVGAVLFFASNWPVIPGWAKLVTIYAAVAASYHAGYRLRYDTPGYPGTGNALLFLGTLLYGAGIFLVAIGFNVNANEPVLLILWCAGVLPLSYLLGSRAMLLLVILGFGIAIVWETAFWFGDDIPPTAILWGFIVYGAMLYGLGNLHGQSGRFREFGRPFAVLGSIAVLGALFPLTFGEFYNAPFRALSFSDISGAVVIRAGFLILAAVAVWIAHLRFVRVPSTSVAEGAAIGVTILLGVLVLVYGGIVSPVAAVPLNLVMLALILGLIGAGYANRKPELINIGIAFFGLLTIARYSDLFWRTLDRSLFFAGAGALLLLGGMFLERTRRHVLRGIDGGCRAGSAAIDKRDP